MLLQEIIIHKRQKQQLPASEIETFVAAITDGRASEGQVAAFCMATLLNGMNIEERAHLTRAMAHSGTVIDWTSENLGGPVIDKHSSGGVGDKVSLLLAPIIAACGGYDPMIAGRGLGHAGGTIDKLEAIPGYNTEMSLPAFKKIVKDCGCAIMAATPDIAPADKKMYAIRDVTGSVESLDLITTSILSKKLSAGLVALVMDVKWGSGAYMKTLKEGRALADSIVRVANEAGLPTVALLTDMNQALGTTAGNALEVAECINILKSGKGDQRLIDVTHALCAEMLVLGKLAETIEEGLEQSKAALESGRAAEKFSQMVTAMGGPADLINNPDHHLQTAAVRLDVFADNAGTIESINTRTLGIAVIELGGGRRVPTDTIDHSVGLSNILGIGETTDTQTPLCTIHAKSPDDAKAVESMIQQAYMLGGNPNKTSIVTERIA